MTLPPLDAVYKIGGIVGLIGTIAYSAWHGVSGTFVHQTAYDSARTVDQQEHIKDDAAREYIKVHVDSIELRVRQIQCGQKVNEGCR